MISFTTMAVTMTMQDIAGDVGVSVVTVSKVLRNKAETSVATRKRVLRRAKALNYQTNWVARSLVTLCPMASLCYNDPRGRRRRAGHLRSRLQSARRHCGRGGQNVHYSDFLAVPLTTVDQGTSEIGKRAANLLLERIGAKRAVRPSKVLIVPRLVERQSTRRGK
jgi:DNA-binding LacI/PurR family transcriptional regulator